LNEAPVITRLAPSPTGALHLGNARTFLFNWLLARTRGWRVVLRIEDIDGPRIKPGAGDAALADLRWLGIDWDDGPVYQSTRSEHYAGAIDQLIGQGDAYPCVCTRREVDLAASAPHVDDGSAVYPGTCCGRFESVAEAARVSGREPALRFHVPEGAVSFVDTVAGERTFDVAQQLGDFVIRKADQTPAYQLAVVVDDADMGISQVVRGGDLIDSTPRQMLLYRALGWVNRIPTYTHLPLVVGPDGRRLAKRHGDSRLSHYRDAGASPGQVLSLLAGWCGMSTEANVTITDLLRVFDPSRLPHGPIVFDARAFDLSRTT